MALTTCVVMPGFIPGIHSGEGPESMNTWMASRP
jgi:hypothetical protein